MRIEDPSTPLNDLRMSEKNAPLLEAVKKHIVDNCDPIVEEFERLGANRTDRWSLCTRSAGIVGRRKRRRKEVRPLEFFSCLTLKPAKVCRTSITHLSRWSLVKTNWLPNL